MNSPGERSGGVIIYLSRKLKTGSNIPYGLWPEIVQAAIWILNRMPTHMKDDKEWIVPWDKARSYLDDRGVKKSDLNSLKIYGSLAYCRTQGIKQKDKLMPRGEIGFLVGYEASNV